MGSLVGRTLDHYEIVKKIGAGGMGEVYRARDPRLGREVAIKVIHSSLSQNTKRLARFEQEARAAGNLNHPNVLAIYDVGNDEGMPFLVTELLEGETLRNRIEDGSLTRRKAVEYAAQIADGLAAAHGRNIVHRDLKPDNVFITRDGHLKILDFGLAKLTERETENPVSAESPTETLNEATAVVGTPGYMSPEQLRGTPADPRADIFAFGVILYEMISGRRPFVGDTDAEISASIMRDDPLPLSDLQHPVPPTLDRLVRQCLEKNPGERFESAHDLAHMLRAVAESSGPTGEVDIPAKPLRRWRSGVLVLGAAVLGFALAYAAYNWFWPKELPTRKHIAVMRFQTLTSTPEEVAYADGLSDQLISGLEVVERSSKGRMWVVQSSDALGWNAKTRQELWYSFNPSLVVVGTVDRTRDRVDVELKVIDPSTGRELRKTRFSNRRDNLEGLQQQPILELTQMLELEVPSNFLELIAEDATTVIAAYEAFTEGIGALTWAEETEDVDRAFVSLENAVDADPRFGRAQVALSRACLQRYKRSGDPAWFERGLEEAERGGAISERPGSAYKVTADLYLAAGQPDNAVVALEEATRLSPDLGNLQVALGNARKAADRPTDAEAAFRRSIFMRPAYPVGHLELGVMFLNRGQYEVAANEFRDAIAHAPNCAVAQTDLGIVYYHLGRLDEARTAFEQSLGIEPNYLAYVNLGTLHFQASRYGDAVAMFSHARDLKEDEYIVWGHLAHSYASSAEPEKADAAFRRAIELGTAQMTPRPDDLWLVIDLAGYHAMLNETDRGVELLEVAIARQPVDPALTAAIGETFEDLGEREFALEWIGKALSAGMPPAWFEGRPSLSQLLADERYQRLAGETQGTG